MIDRRVLVAIGVLAFPCAIVDVSSTCRERVNGVLARPEILPTDVNRQHLIDIVDLSGAVNSVRAHVTNHERRIGGDLTLDAEVILNYIGTFRSPFDKGHSIAASC